MKQYKLSYTFNLKGSPGGFCIDPLSIFQQMEKAQADTLGKVKKIIADEKREAEVQGIRGVPRENALLVICSEDVARRLGKAGFLTSVEEYAPPSPPPSPPGFKS